MAMQIVNFNGIRVARPRGVFVGSAKASIEAQLNTLLEPISDAPKFVFNLEFIDGLDSNGVDILVAMNVRIHHIGGRMAIININKHIDALLVDGNLPSVFEWYNSEDSAVVSLQT